MQFYGDTSVSLSLKKSDQKLMFSSITQLTGKSMYFASRNIFTNMQSFHLIICEWVLALVMNVFSVNDSVRTLVSCNF